MWDGAEEIGPLRSNHAKNLGPRSANPSLVTTLLCDLARSLYISELGMLTLFG